MNNKKSCPVKTAMFVLLAASVLIACAGAPHFADVLDKDWKLSEVRIGGTDIGFERGKLADEGFGEVFTLRFDNERINGIGAPNRYFAPYTLGDKNSIAIKAIAGTMMAAFREPEALKEHEYFTLLQNTGKWNLVKGNLTLYSKNADGAEAVLVFSE